MRFGPLLRLLRLPAVFTTFPDVLAGFALVFAAAELSQLIWLLLSSACLYLSGMVLNDCFDVEDDRRERANRPIPQGEISLATGWKLASLLMLAGIGFAGLGGTVSLAVSIVLAGTILAYDAGGKKTVIGPLLMGLCRGNNLLLGASAAGEVSALFAVPVICCAGLITLYVIGVTIFAFSEQTVSSRQRLRTGLGCCLLAMIGWGMLASFRSSQDAIRIVAVMLFLIAFQILRKAMPALRTREPDAVQGTIKAMLLAIPMLEAVVIIAHGGPGTLSLAIAAALMMLPGQLLARIIPMT
ncbi:MAG: UbiA family prenyltransferase [Planctomycetaceae bacterium]|nr:UbiA family prenyltransferase [Planctomycetaceae bacterium]